MYAANHFLKMFLGREWVLMG